jgi:chromosome segregation ATPase
MEIKAAIVEAIKELVVPEMDEIKSDLQELKAVQQMTNKRIDDLNGHLVDLSRRVDQVRTEFNERIDSLNHSLSTRIDVTNDRIDRLYDVVVRREEHEGLRKNLHAFNRRLKRLEEKVGVI